MAKCLTCHDTGWEELTDVPTVKGNRASVAVRRCPNGCPLLPYVGVRAATIPADAQFEPADDEGASFA